MDAKRPSPDQLNLDFTSKRNELIALVSGLRRLPLPFTPARVEGIVTLLRRLILLAREIDDRGVVVEQPKSKIAAGFTGERGFSEKTIQNWKRDAIAIGVLQVQVRAERGWYWWNRWIVDLDGVRRLLAETGRDWKRLETPSTLGVETPSTLLIFQKHVSKEHLTSLQAVTCGDVGLAADRVQTREADVQTRLGNPWSIEVTPSNLAKPETVKQLHGEAVAKGWWLDGEAGRLSWATLCLYVAREGREPGRLLTTCARAGSHNGTQADEAKARRLVERAWSGIDSEEAERVLDAMTEREFRDWLRTHVPPRQEGDRGERELDGMAVYGRERGGTMRPRLVRVMAQTLSLAEVST